MAHDKKSFLLYCDLIHTVNQLPDDKAGILFKHILEYVNDNDPKSDDIIINISFEPIKQQLKRDLEKYQSIIERNKINGSKGGRPKKQGEPKKPSGLIGNPKKPKKADIDNDIDSDIDIDINNIPSFDDFKNYVLEKEPLIDISALKNKYDSWKENNWKDGNDKKIKNWKSKILNTIPYLPKLQNNQKPLRTHKWIEGFDTKYGTLEEYNELKRLRPNADIHSIKEL